MKKRIGLIFIVVAIMVAILAGIVCLGHSDSKIKNGTTTPAVAYAEGKYHDRFVQEKEPFSYNNEFVTKVSDSNGVIFNVFGNSKDLPQTDDYPLAIIDKALKDTISVSNENVKIGVKCSYNTELSEKEIANMRKMNIYDICSNYPLDSILVVVSLKNTRAIDYEKELWSIYSILAKLGVTDTKIEIYTSENTNREIEDVVADMRLYYKENLKNGANVYENIEITNMSMTKEEFNQTIN